MASDARRSDPPMLESGDGAVMDWVLFAPEKAGDTFGFEFRKDCDCGSLDHLHVEPEDVPRLIAFLGGIPRDDVRAAIDELRDSRLHAYQDTVAAQNHEGGYRHALKDVADRLGLTTERGSDGSD